MTPAGPPRRGLHLRDFARTVLLLAVLFALFRDDVRQHPGEVARDLARNLLVIGPALLLAPAAQRLGRAGTARLVSWGATRPGRARRLIALAAVVLWWVALLAVLVGGGLVARRWGEAWLPRQWG